MPVRSSIEVLTSRFKALEQVGMNRDREVSAIQDQFAYLQRTMLQRFDDVTSRFQSKMEDAVWKKMQGVEKEIRDSVQEDLAVLNMNPMDKKVESAKEAASSIKPTAADDSLREHAEAADRELATVTAERDTARQQLETAEGQLKDANGHITRLTAETSKMKELEEAHAALTAQLGAVSADVADLRTQREYLRTQLAEAEAERDTLRTQMAERAAAPTVSTQGDKVEDPVKVEAQSPETDTPNPVPEETEPASLSEFIRENPNQSKAKEEPEADDPWRESQ
ncbi:hypothetical protein DFJ77DRAFT_320023 [Powellomyces hirtus]|nr:hypothetical protein DFJ77DRAFT_320023 [Powellomyces hirtus]